MRNLRSGVLFSEERESIATLESAVWKREMRCREGGYDRRLGMRKRAFSNVSGA